MPTSQQIRSLINNIPEVEDAQLQDTVLVATLTTGNTSKISGDLGIKEIERQLRRDIMTYKRKLLLDA